MQQVPVRFRRFVRGARRRARVLLRSLLLHVLVLALVVLGLLVRMSESSDVQLALAQRSLALARLDESAWPHVGGASSMARARAASDFPAPFVPFPEPSAVPLGVVPITGLEALAADATRGQPRAPASGAGRAH